MKVYSLNQQTLPVHKDSILVQSNLKSRFGSKALELQHIELNPKVIGYKQGSRCCDDITHWSGPLVKSISSTNPFFLGKIETGKRMLRASFKVILRTSFQIYTPIVPWLPTFLPDLYSRQFNHTRIEKLSYFRRFIGSAPDSKLVYRLPTIASSL
ncbi:hypothetical protein RRG08_024576 [Elysia crispata]|uniref:Uncharacterized protein n=1 Tax=Elysia crispata TaxID=231223 RepID=A0AAE0ZW75_9GAST|nr:hypothetical protein RRG08_024576 [Elysia crispata]